MASAEIPTMLGSPLGLGVAMLALAIIPFGLLSVTSFVKLHIVFNVLKNALGAQQIPSSAITSLLALVLTVYVMEPVAKKSFAAMQLLPIAPSVEKKAKPLASGAGAMVFDPSALLTKAAAGSAPLLDFLTRHSRMRERLFFLKLRESEARPLPENSIEAPSCIPSDTEPGVCRLPGEGFFSLIPAFVLSELREAFQLGFLLFLPFLVIDLVVANLLVGVGMSMVTPQTVSLPLKIILFVSCDGWFLLCKSLILGYR